MLPEDNNRNEIQPANMRKVIIGGMTKDQLVQALERQSIHLNQSAGRLLSSELFTVSAGEKRLLTVEITVGELGFAHGATLAEIFEKAGMMGLDLCPAELGPYMRLQYPDQPEGFLGKPVTQNRAPYGSLTIASPILSEEDDFPKGFYLRKMAGVLWLRGYRASMDFVWNPEDSFVFLKKE